MHRIGVVLELLEKRNEKDLQNTSLDAADDEHYDNWIQLIKNHSSLTAVRASKH